MESYNLKINNRVVYLKLQIPELSNANQLELVFEQKHWEGCQEMAETLKFMSQLLHICCTNIIMKKGLVSWQENLMPGAFEIIK